jgi:hypothetical protein
MCPVCPAAIGLYVAGGVSAGAVATFLTTKLLRKQPEPTALTTSSQTEGDDHATTDLHVVIDGAGWCSDKKGEKQ